MAKNKTSRFGVADDFKYYKNFNNQLDAYNKNDNADKFRSEINQKQEYTKPDQKKSKRDGAYRFSLYMDPDLGEYVNYIKFKRKKSITDFFNDIVREKMECDISWQTLKK